MSLGESTRIALSGGKAFRAPDATDRFGFGGNPDLQPEVSEQYELSLRQQLGEQHQLTLAAFDNEIEDLINYVITDFTTFEGSNQNIDRARIKGVELGYRSRPKAGVPARSSRCRIRATKPPTSACCAARARRWCSR